MPDVLRAMLVALGDRPSADPGPRAMIYFYLILDLFSRKIVGFEVHGSASARIRASRSKRWSRVWSQQYCRCRSLRLHLHRGHRSKALRGGIRRTRRAIPDWSVKDGDRTHSSGLFDDVADR
jgi:hypothetical protein